MYFEFDDSEIDWSFYEKLNLKRSSDGNCIDGRLNKNVKSFSFWLGECWEDLDWFCGDPNFLVVIFLVGDFKVWPQLQSFLKFNSIWNEMQF